MEAKEETAPWGCIVMALLWLLILVALKIGALVVAVHFIRKFW